MKFFRLIKAELYTLYHGSDNLFSEFKKGFNNAVNAYGDGIYFTNKRASAKRYGKYLYKCKATINNPYITSITSIKSYELTNKTEEIIKQGYDAIILTGNPDETIYVIFEPAQIKIEQITEYNYHRQKINIFNQKDIQENTYEIF